MFSQWGFSGFWARTFLSFFIRVKCDGFSGEILQNLLQEKEVWHLEITVLLKHFSSVHFHVVSYSLVSYGDIKEPPCCSPLIGDSKRLMYTLTGLSHLYFWVKCDGFLDGNNVLFCESLEKLFFSSPMCTTNGR